MCSFLLSLTRHSQRETTREGVLPVIPDEFWQLGKRLLSSPQPVPARTVLDLRVVRLSRVGQREDQIALAPPEEKAVVVASSQCLFGLDSANFPVIPLFLVSQ